jgi:hypothetical protein
MFDLDLDNMAPGRFRAAIIRTSWKAAIGCTLETIASWTQIADRRLRRSVRAAGRRRHEVIGKAIRNHHRYRFLALLTTVAFATVVAAPAAAQPARPSVEPGSGQWPTWLLTAGDELRLPPPVVANTPAELAEVQAVAAGRDGAMLERIRYWDAGAPPYRWTQRAVKYAQDHGMGAPRAGRMLALMNVAMYDATVAAWDTKYAYNRPPSERPATVAGSRHIAGKPVIPG